MSDVWSYAEVAEHLGVSDGTVRAYKHRGYLPRPDGVLGKSPWWRPATIIQWQQQRPGQGARHGDKTPPVPAPDHATD